MIAPAVLLVRIARRDEKGNHREANSDDVRQQVSSIRHDRYGVCKVAPDNFDCHEDECEKGDKDQLSESFLVPLLHFNFALNEGWEGFFFACVVVIVVIVIVVIVIVVIVVVVVVGVAPMLTMVMMVLMVMRMRDQTR